MLEVDASIYVVYLICLRATEQHLATQLIYDSKTVYKNVRYSVNIILKARFLDTPQKLVEHMLLRILEKKYILPLQNTYIVMYIYKYIIYIRLFSIKNKLSNVTCT